MLNAALLLLGIWLVVWLMIIVRVWRASTLDGILTVLVPFYVVIPLVRNWGKPDYDIRYLLLAQFLLGAGAGAAAQQYAQGLPVQANATEQQSAAHAAAGPAGRTNDTTPTSPHSTSTAATVDDSTAPADAPPRRVTPSELRYLTSAVTFSRGRFAREILGLQFDIPSGYHMLDGVQARRVQGALTGSADEQLIGMVIGEDGVFSDPTLPIVQLRWLNDGLVTPTAEALDPAPLLAAATAGPHISRLVDSGGHLLRYVSPPIRSGPTIVWSEERQLADAKKTSFDCHALRLARKGVLEFSLVGLDAAAVKSCAATLRQFVDRSRFLPDYDYPAEGDSARLAPYSLVSLITQTP